MLLPAAAATALPGALAGQPDPSRASRADAPACDACHAATTSYGHPVGVRVAGAAPAGLPLGPAGEVRCATCHLAHEAGGGLRPALRGRGRCSACHDERFFERMADRGLAVRGRAHPVRALPGEPRARASLAAGRDPGIDRVSAWCLECHAERGEAHRGSGFGGFGARINHPVGIRYASYESYGGYVPRGSLPPQVALPGGVVSCASCHQTYSREHGALVLPRRGSALCFGCHDV